VKTLAEAKTILGLDDSTGELEEVMKLVNNSKSKPTSAGQK
jgi:hypothetical protein